MRAIIGFIILLALVIFLLSNRGPVDLGYWPFGLFLTLPLFAPILFALALGFLAGLALHLPARFGAERRARRAEKCVSELQGQLGARTSPAPPP